MFNNNLSLQALPELYNPLTSVNQNSANDTNLDSRLRIASSELIGDKADRHFFECGAEAEYAINFDGTVDGGNVSVFKSD